MSDLLSILNAGAAALSAQQQAAATASHNLQNANTAGYARQRLELAAVLPAERVQGGYIGRGAVVQTITQARDRFLEAQIPGQLGLAAGASARSAALDAVSALDPDTAGNLGAALSAFYTSLRQLTQNPSDAGLRASVLGSATTLALAFNRTRGALEEARTGVDQRLASTVAEANDLGRQVAAYNADIRAARAGGAGEPNDLLDARQKAVDRLAELTGARPVPTSEGDVSLFLAGGAALVSGTSAGTLSTLGDPADAGHLTLRFAQPGLEARPAGAVGGELGGLLGARDGAMKDAVGGLDQLAFDLAGAVNGVHRAGFGLGGSTGVDLFEAGLSAPGAAARVAVNGAVIADPRLLATASAPGLPGDGTNLARLVDTEATALTGGRTAAQAFAKLTGDFGVAARSAEAAADLEGSLAIHLQGMRESTSGVSIDEELIALQKAQRGYEAITRVIQVSNELFDTLLQLK